MALFHTVSILGNRGNDSLPVPEARIWLPVSSEIPKGSAIIVKFISSYFMAAKYQSVFILPKGKIKDELFTAKMFRWCIISRQIKHKGPMTLQNPKEDLILFAS